MTFIFIEYVYLFWCSKCILIFGYVLHNYQNCRVLFVTLEFCLWLKKMGFFVHLVFQWIKNLVQILDRRQKKMLNGYWT